jgi:hypothetical protein
MFMFFFLALFKCLYFHPSPYNHLNSSLLG